MVIDFELLVMPFENGKRASLKHANLIRSMSEEELDEIKKVKQLSLTCVDNWKSEDIFNSRFPDIRKVAFVKCFSKFNSGTVEYWKNREPNQLVVNFPDFGLDWIDIDKGVTLHAEDGARLGVIAFEGCPNPEFSRDVFSSCIFTPIFKDVVYEAADHAIGSERDNSKLIIGENVYTDFFSAFFNVKNCYSIQEETRFLLCLRASHRIDLPMISSVSIFLKESHLGRMAVL